MTPPLPHPAAAPTTGSTAGSTTTAAAAAAAPAPDSARPLPAERRRTREFVSTFWRTVSLRVGAVAVALYGGTLWYGRELFARLTVGELTLVALAALSFAVILLGLVMIFVIVPLVSRPTARLAAVTESVARGDLSIKITGRNGTGEMVRLWKAVGEMIGALRDMAVALRASAAETAALAGEINAGTEHMSAAAQEMASTSNELSAQSTEMASTIQQMAADAATLVAISAELAAGAQDGVARNAQLRALAEENRARLDSSAHTLGALADDVRSSATAVEAVASASEEVRAFVAYVQKMARQSKLLALNAAMEAARAGEHGQGFAVVASEVRRLAANSAEAAEKTEVLVRGVLERVAESRELSSRAVATVAEVLDATNQGMTSFGEVERAVADAEQWTAAIAHAADSSNTLVSETMTRIDELARGTEAFAAAMEQVAASSQEQSASTEQIAAASHALGGAAGRLAALIATFKLGDGDVSSPSQRIAPAPAAVVAAVPAPTTTPRPRLVAAA